MIRVVYRWAVAPAAIAAFRTAWRETTLRIHEGVAGARGSFLLQEAGDPGSILTVARWDSLEDWHRFWQDDNPHEMVAMRRLGDRRGVEIYEEFEDHTR